VAEDPRQEAEESGEAIAGSATDPRATARSRGAGVPPLNCILAFNLAGPVGLAFRVSRPMKTMARVQKERAGRSSASLHLN